MRCLSVGGTGGRRVGWPRRVYGGIGRNDARRTPEAVAGKLLQVGDSYQLERGRLFNLNANAVITGHSDICKPEVVYAVLAAVRLT
jgi:hypothetical protein